MFGLLDQDVGKAQLCRTGSRAQTRRPGTDNGNPV